MMNNLTPLGQNSPRPSNNNQQTKNSLENPNPFGTNSQRSVSDGTEIKTSQFPDITVTETNTTTTPTKNPIRDYIPNLTAEKEARDLMMGIK